VTNAVINHQRVIVVAREFAESNMTAEVSITRKASAVFDAETGSLTSGEPVVVYEGKARIYTVQGPVQNSYGDEPTYFSSTIVSVPVVTATLPRVDDLIEVTAHMADPIMVGRVFRVQDVEAGGQWMAARKLQVTGVQESQQWATS
jgi:hypothetical protein